MGAVKRHLEEQTDAVLDCVRSFGVAVLVPLGVGPTAHTAALERVRELGREWLCTDSVAEAELQRTLGALAVWEDCPPPQDLLWEWRDALEDCALSVVEAVAEWLEPYGLELEWTAAGLVARRAEEDRVQLDLDGLEVETLRGLLAETLDGVEDIHPLRALLETLEKDAE